jgi:hypothetical protein
LIIAAKILSPVFCFLTPELLRSLPPSVSPSMDIDTTFPTKLDTVSDTPEPLRSALLESLPSGETIRLLVHSPAFPTGEEKSPATVLAVTNSGWLLASETEEGGAKLDKSSFDDILFLELRSILLLGQLRICSAPTSSVTIQYDAIGDEYYCEAIDLLLSGIDPARAEATGKEQNEASMFADWPMKFRNEAKRYRPSGQRLLAATRWVAIFDEFQRQIAPAGALLITERELVLISDEKQSSAETSSLAEATESGSVRETPQSSEPLEKVTSVEMASDPIEKTEVDPDKLPADVYEFSEIITYIPRERLASFQLHHQDRFWVLALEVHGKHGGVKLEINFPSEDETAVSKALEQWSL